MFSNANQLVCDLSCVRCRPTLMKGAPWFLYLGWCLEIKESIWGKCQIVLTCKMRGLVWDGHIFHDLCPPPPPPPPPSPWSCIAFTATPSLFTFFIFKLICLCSCSFRLLPHPFTPSHPVSPDSSFFCLRAGSRQIPYMSVLHSSLHFLSRCHCCLAPASYGRWTHSNLRKP